MTKPKTPKATAAFAGLESNLDDTASVLAPAVEKKARPVAEKRVRIMLEENDAIPPTGQFIGVQGKGYILRPGEEADVPPGVINVLDTAVEEVPIFDSGRSVIGYKKKLRFPYRVITPGRVG